jgi:hypothetical protein
MTGFTNVLRPEKFFGAHFKRWRVKVTLWLEAMKVFWITVGSPEGNISEEDQIRFQEDNTIFRGTNLNSLAGHLVDANLHFQDRKALRDHLNTTFGASDACGEVNIMESFHDCKKVGNRSIVEQANEVQHMARELELIKCVIPDEFVVGCIIAICLFHGGALAGLLNTRDRKYQCEDKCEDISVKTWRGFGRTLKISVKTW